MTQPSGSTQEPGTALAPSSENALAETTSTAVAAREKAAVEARFLVAMHRPRNPDQARLRILDACKRPRFAENARYSKPVGDKRVTGLSIRFAEEAGRAWGNIDIAAVIVFDDRERRIYRVTGTDLETNATQHQDVIVEKVVERRNPRPGQTVIGSRTNSTGSKVYLIEASEDELLNKANAMLSKARRNVMLMLIPSDVCEEAEEQAIATLADRAAKDPAGERKRITEAFWTLGVTPEQIVDFLGKPLEALNPAELNLLRTVYTAIRDGETTWGVAVEELKAKKPGAAPAAPAAPTKGAAGLKEKIGAKAAPAAPEQLAPAPAAGPLVEEAVTFPDDDDL
jgi:hypothetical protein